MFEKTESMTAAFFSARDTRHQIGNNSSLTARPRADGDHTGLGVNTKPKIACESYVILSRAFEDRQIVR